MTPAETNIDELALVAAPADVAMAFGIDEGEPVVRCMCLQGTATTPYRIAENFYPVSLAMSKFPPAYFQNLQNVGREARKEVGILRK